MESTGKVNGFLLYGFRQNRSISKKTGEGQVIWKLTQRPKEKEGTCKDKETSIDEQRRINIKLKQKYTSAPEKMRKSTKNKGIAT